MASIIKKTYHIRKYDNIDYEMKKKIAVKKGKNGIVINIDDDKNEAKKNSLSFQSERQKIYPIKQKIKAGKKVIEEDETKS
jgi:hypothetical protein